MNKTNILTIAVATAIIALPLKAQAQAVEEEATAMIDEEGQDEEPGDSEAPTDNDEAPTANDEVELPEAMTIDIDSLLHLYNSTVYLNIDTECDYPNVNPQYPDSVIIDRLTRLPNIMEMAFNHVVRNIIDRYSGRMRNTVSYWLGAANFYMPIFEQALESYGLPLELKYLPVIESGLNPNAVSRAGATGLWQFMLATGKQYGLTVNSLVDERRDPIKASYAAAHYLKDLYRIFGDWNLVIAAYNCGPENVNRAIHRAGGVKDYWAIYPYLPRETQGYVPAFIAANYMMSYYCEHNICPMRSKLPIKTDTVMVGRDVHLQQIAAVCNVSIDELRTLNPQYRRDIVNGSTQPSAVRLPMAAINTFIDNEDSVYTYNAEQLLTRRSVAEVNQGRATDKSTKRRSSRGRKTVTVRKGDTLSQIAARNGTTVAKLRRLNGIKGNNIRAGSKLRVR